MKTKQKKCKHCGNKFIPHNTLQPVCFKYECILWNLNKAKKRKEKKERQEHAKRKRDFYDKDIKTRKKGAYKACHQYIRLRDKGKPCICCNRPWKPTFEAGHFLNSGNNPAIRYNEDNINSQSVYCNKYMGGNIGEYEKNLRIKIGDERVERLLSLKGKSFKWTPEKLKEIEAYYKKKINELKKGVDKGVGV